MKKWKNESGRSILEMLAVIAIIALLTVGGLAGYSFLVQKNKRNESVKQATQLVVGMKTVGDLGRYAADGKVVKASKVVKGLDTSKTAGEVVELPDGESFLVVTKLKNSFAVHLKAESRELFEDVAKALNGPGVSVFKNDEAAKQESPSDFARYAENWSGQTHAGAGTGAGVRYGSKEYLEELADAKGATIVIGCGSGMSVYTNITDLACDDCELQGWMRDPTTYECCNPAEACGSVCKCDAHQVCMGPNGSSGAGVDASCVECLTDGDCYNGTDTTKAFNKFAQKVCDTNTHKCVECLADGDCASGKLLSTMLDYTKYAGRDLKYCDTNNHYCYECLSNHDSTGATVGHCPNENFPVCRFDDDNVGHCERCPDGYTYNKSAQKCECDTGVTYDGQCGVCFDTAAGKESDLGCNDSSKPVCTDDAGSNFAGGSGFEGTQCVQCTNDDQCPNGTCFNNQCVRCRDNQSGDGNDAGCAMRGCDGESKNFCKPNGNATGNGTGEVGSECFVCQNNESGNATDYGCVSGKPFCIANDNEYGNACAYCINDNTGADAGDVDTGCTPEKPLCKKFGTDAIGPNEGGDECREIPVPPFCTDTKTAVEYDNGCTNTADQLPICVMGADSSDWVNNGQGTPGDRCIQCVTDTNCTSLFGTAIDAKKKCDTDNNACRVCKNDKTGKGTDLGCNDASPLCSSSDGEYGDKCWHCKNDQDGDAKDTGCGEGNDDGMNLCRAAADEWGTACAKCIDDQDGDGQDTGCSPDLPRCANAEGNALASRGAYGVQCVARGAFCNDTKSGVEYDRGCTDTTNKLPICVAGTNASTWLNNAQGTAGDHCIQCVTDDNCTSLFGTGIDNKKLCGSDNLCKVCQQSRTFSDSVDNGCNSDKPLCNTLTQNGYGTMCKRCKNDHDGDQKDMGCTDPTKPICADSEGNVITEINVYGDQCIAAPSCRDTKATAERDSGCGNADHPFCVMTTDPAPWQNEGQNAAGNACVQCRFNNNDCTKLSELGVFGKDSSGANVQKKACGSDHLCKVCINDDITTTATGIAKDSGCWDGRPMCNSSTKGHSGTACMKCINDKNYLTKDTGCSDDKPICANADGTWKDTADNKYGDQCISKKCVNDHANDGRDTGCETDKPICANADGTWNDEVDNKLGSQCIAKPSCRDTKANGENDQGCTALDYRPFCIDDTKSYWLNKGDGHPGKHCAQCRDSKTQVSTDCKAQSNLGHYGNDVKRNVCHVTDANNRRNSVCVSCVNDQSGDKTDLGCSSSTPLCPTGANTIGETSNKVCKKCYNNKGAGKVDNGCSEKKPYCGAASDKYGDACGSCVNDKDGVTTDTGCTTDAPMCVGADGKVNFSADNTAGTKCSKPCETGKCLGFDGKTCVKMSSYDDLSVTKTGKCLCQLTVESNQVSDMGNKLSSWVDTDCWRSTNSRQRRYSIPVKFYCERNFVADGKADDYVVSSSPAGIGANSKHDTWAEHANNSISPQKAKTGDKINYIKGNTTATLVVGDIWEREVGYSGKFTFTCSKAEQNANHCNSATKANVLSVKIDWKKGDTPGAARCKNGEKGCSCKNGQTQSRSDATKKKTEQTCFYDPKATHGNCTYESGRVHSTHCFSKVWVSSHSDSSKTKCSISSDKHTVKASGGMCMGEYYTASTCK